MAMNIGTKQSLLMGLIFLFVFAAYLTIQGFAAKLYGQTLGSNMELTLYAVFTGACFISPAITNILGPRLTLFMGIQGYACLVVASMLFSAFGDQVWTDVIVIAGGGVLGVGAAMLWTAQGRLILEWSDGTDAARLYGLFWAIFNCSALFGGLLSFVYFSTHDTKAPTGLFIGFLALIFVGSACVFLLAKPPVSS